MHSCYIGSNTLSIELLIKKYEDNLDYYQSSKYNETQLRVDFLDPMFELLGWDIKNNKGKNTHEREVLLEEGLKLKKGASTKKPDYTFRLFSERRFFLEAKKPSVDIASDPSPAKQVRRYGFTAKLKISILSNFENLAIYECSSPVKEDDETTAYRVRLYHYTEYIEKFDEIYALLSQESVYGGSFDSQWKNIEEKIQKFSVDDLFLAQINEWRINLADNFLRIKPEIGQEELNDLTQSYINSIVFLRVCEDRNLEDYETLLELSKDADFDLLTDKFTQADKKYNSALFNIPYIEEFFSDKNSYIWEIFKSLYYPESTYSFSVFSSDILGNIYETFLGEKIIINNGSPELTPKPENEDRDIVTTPNHIIKNILRKTVTPKLENKNVNEILETTIADISCGSGAFLLEAYQLVHDTIVDYYSVHDVTKLIQVAENSFKLKYDIKRKILTKCIFGIDKDYSATQACKFGLLLKLLEGEDNSSISSPALPILDNNIIFGNSLIDDSMSLTPIDQEINAYNFDKQAFDVIIGNPPYLNTEGMKAITPKELKLYKEHYDSAYKQFDKYFLFVERALSLLSDGGVMGYILPLKFMKVGAGKNLRTILSTKGYVSEITSFGANQVFKDKTTYTCILILNKEESAEFMYLEVGGLDEWITRNTNERETNIVNRDDISGDTWVLMRSELEPAYEKIIQSSDTLENIIGSENIINGIQTSANNIYIHKPTKDDGTYVYFKKGGVDWKIEKALTKPYFKTQQGVRGLHSHRRFEANAFVIYPYEKIGGKVVLVELDDLEIRFPFLHAYLLANKEKLDNVKRDIRPIPKTENEWHRYGRHQSLDNCAVPTKIIVGVLSQGNKYAIDYSGALISSGGTAGYCMIAIPEEIPYSVHYIQALLNSKYGEWFASLYGEIFRGGYIARGTKVFNRLPIIEIDFNSKKSKSIHDNIASAQKKIIEAFTDLDLHEDNPRNKIIAERKYIKLTKKMDVLLQELFQLEELDEQIPIISQIY
ncbi:MAG: Eco57I restriction-modification methylase domain-containing protein [Alphaproteobacteria bacterium]